MSETIERKMARFLRVATVRNVLGQDLITREDALELLRGPLTPGDVSTIIDDTVLLDMTIDEVQTTLGLKEKEEK